MRIVDSVDEPMFTVAETAAMLRVAPVTVRRLIDRHELRAVRLGRVQGRSIRVPASALEEARSRPVKEEP